MLSLFNFFYIDRRKYWFRPNFRLPVFDGFYIYEKKKPILKTLCDAKQTINNEQGILKLVFPYIDASNYLNLNFENFQNAFNLHFARLSKD